MRPYRPSSRLLVWAAVGLVVAVAQSGDAPPAPAKDGVALAIVFDTSGSMKDDVPDRGGRPTPKYVIANRALLAVTERLEAFRKGPAAETGRELYAGLITFRSGRPFEEIRMTNFVPDRFRRWAGGFSAPQGATPLGESIRLGARRVLDSPLTRKHVLVVTDGVNTAGPDPASVLPALRKQVEKQQTVVGFHFVAFDVEASVFSPLKQLGATVVGAADERQLESQLRTILERKILLEEEEPTDSASGAMNRK